MVLWILAFDEVDNDPDNGPNNNDPEQCPDGIIDGATKESGQNDKKE